MRKGAILLLGITGALVVIGGAYYAVAVLWPARYARAVLAIEYEVRKASTTVGQPPAGDSPDDVQQVLRFVDAQRAVFQRLLERVQRLRPPPQYRQLQADLGRGAPWLVEHTSELERRVKFVVGARELHRLIRAELSPKEGPTLALGQFLARFEPNLRVIQTTGDALFAGTLPQAPGLPELQAAWQAARTGLETLLLKLRSEDQGVPFLTAVGRFETDPDARAAEAALERFLSLLDPVATSSVSATVSSSLLPSPPPELSATFSRLSEELNALKQRYPQYVQDGSR